MYAFAPSNLELVGLCAKAWLSLPAQKLLDDRERAALAQRDAGEEREEQVAGEDGEPVLSSFGGNHRVAIGAPPAVWPPTWLAFGICLP